MKLILKNSSKFSLFIIIIKIRKVFSEYDFFNIMILIFLVYFKNSIFYIIIILPFFSINDMKSSHA